MEQNNLQLQVLHIEKRAGIPGGLNRHILREQWVLKNDGTFRKELWVPNNADPKRSAGNRDLIPREGLSLQQLVDRRIAEAGVTVRKGQNKCLEIIISGSRETMNSMSYEKLLAWSDDVLNWGRRNFGDENVISATLHVDEMTPHIHMVVVPIVQGQSRRTRARAEALAAEGKDVKTYKKDHNKNRLCVSEVFTRGKLYAYHDSLYKEVSCKYGLGRGVKAAPGCHKNHMDSVEYNRRLKQAVSRNREMVRALSLFRKDSADAEIALKRQELDAINNMITDKKTELTKEDANLSRLRTQLTAKAKPIEKVPKKGTFGYKTAEVDAFIEAVDPARILADINRIPRGSDTERSLRSEVERLREIETRYYSLIRSPEDLQKQIEFLRREKVAELFRYVLQRDVSVNRYEIEPTDNGQEVLAMVTFDGNPKPYSAFFRGETVSYTDKLFSSLRECRKHLGDKIWYNVQAPQQNEKTKGRKM